MGMFYIGDGVGKNIIYPTFFSGFCPVLIVARPDSAWRENLTAPHPNPQHTAEVQTLHSVSVNLGKGHRSITVTAGLSPE